MSSGPLETEAWVVPSAGAKLELRKITLPPLENTEVECDMLITGLCHTDIHMRDNDWGTSDYPLVPGHEGVGIVRAIGSEVKGLKIGDRVAIAWIRDSCKTCSNCHKGRENICKAGYQGTYLGAHSGIWGKKAYNEHGGCMSRVSRIEERFAIKIPDNVPSDVACPLLCGGGTVFEPLCDFTEQGSNVGIVGIGGLGTAAIKLAKLKGCNVTALSTSAHKREGVLAAGADSFVLLSNQAQVDTLKKESLLDLIIDTTPVNQPVSHYLDLLALDGIYCRVGIPSAKDQVFDYNWIPLIFTQKKIVGSVVTGSKRMVEMLELTSKNLSFMSSNEHWKTQTMSMSKVNEAMDQLLTRKNDGYRIVLDWSI